MSPALFRQLSETEEVSFRRWAHDNYMPHSPISSVWHPSVQDECRKINEALTESVNRATDNSRAKEKVQ